MNLVRTMAGISKAEDSGGWMPKSGLPRRFSSLSGGRLTTIDPAGLLPRREMLPKI